MAKIKTDKSTPYVYAHMCRDEHTQIGHNDSNNELCPLCRLRVLLRCIEDEWSDGEYLTSATLECIRDELGDD